MTKQQLQKELLEKIKPGTKPSDLRKLKRSKSADDIPSPPLSPTLKIKELEDQVKFHAETSANYLKSLQTSQAKVNELEEKLKNNPPNQLLQEQLKEKQKQIESLRKKLEDQPTLVELDSSSIARHRNLKDWWRQYSQNKKLDQELEENIEQASSELTQQDQVINNLRKEINRLKLTNQSLTKDLNLSQRLAEYRKVSYPDENNWTYLKYALYSLIAVGFTLWLVNNFKNIWASPNNYD